MDNFILLFSTKNLPFCAIHPAKPWASPMKGYQGGVQRQLRDRQRKGEFFFQSLPFLRCGFTSIKGSSRRFIAKRTCSIDLRSHRADIMIYSNRNLTPDINRMFSSILGCKSVRQQDVDLLCNSSQECAVVTTFHWGSVNSCLLYYYYYYFLLKHKMPRL